MIKTQHSKNIMTFHFDFKKKTDVKILALTDIHYDSRYCDRKLLKKHLDECKKENGYIFINGDLFDVMGCYKDPRSKGHDVRPEYLNPETSYLDAIIQDVYQFLKPYRKHILFMGYGNHETAILKHRDTDPLKRLQFLLNQDADILLSQYFGVAKIKFTKNKQSTETSIIVHHHGYGGNAKRSKGVLNVDLDSQTFPFADIYFSGHNHKKWYVPETRYELKANMELVSSTQYHLKGGSYKDGSASFQGWAVEKGMKHTPLGGWWINYTYSPSEYLETKIYEAS